MSWSKVFMFFWPFLKEMILGEKTVKQAVETNKWRVLTLGVILMSISLNFLAVPKLISVTQDYLELRKKYLSSQEEIAKLKSRPPTVIARQEPVRPTAEPRVVPAPPPRRPAQPAPHSGAWPLSSQPAAADAEEERLRQVRERLERLQQQENSQRLQEAVRKDKLK